jgi:hypothetical protein
MTFEKSLGTHVNNEFLRAPVHVENGEVPDTFVVDPEKARDIAEAIDGAETRRTKSGTRLADTLRTIYDLKQTAESTSLDSKSSVKLGMLSRELYGMGSDFKTDTINADNAFHVAEVKYEKGRDIAGAPSTRGPEIRDPLGIRKRQVEKIDPFQGIEEKAS